MKKVTIWRDEYRDVQFEINQFTIGNRPAWTFYIYLDVEQIDKNIWLEGEQMTLGDKKTKHTMYDYNKTIFGNIDFHCGCTYYERHGGEYPWERKSVKAGCDYSHLYDEGRIYNLDMIKRDAMRCIDSLHDIAEIKRRCQYCGEYFTPVGDKARCKACVNK